MHTWKMKQVMLTFVRASAPPGALILLIIFVVMPASFPYKIDPSNPARRLFSLVSYRHLDFPGTFMILAASVLFVTAVQEGGTEYAWNSAVVLSTLCLSAVLWGMFLYWQRHASMPHSERDPVLPWRLLTNRFTVGFIL